MQDQTKTIEYNLTASEFQWEIAKGKAIKAWGFNNQLPGPTLKANVGDTIVIRVKNDLAEPTIIHWHGLRVPATMDGTGMVQAPIQPGESFEYRYKLPDAGTFWYHSHFNETVQVEKGMYGAFIVEELEELIVDAEKLLVIDDIKLDKENSFKKPKGFFSKLKERHDGRQGDTILINGRENPEVLISSGQIERWRIINASSARYVRLFMEGRPFQVIATDGGLIEKPITVTEFLLTPAERVEIIVGPFNEDESFLLESLSYKRMTFLKPKRDLLATIQVTEKKPSKASIPAILRKIDPLANQDAEITRKIKFSVGPSLKHGLNFLVNDHLHHEDKPVQLGTLQVWEIRNASLMDHPFHLHGAFFQVIEVNGKSPAFRSWKDTVNLPPRSTVKIAWIPDHVGKWMYHCHILEHHEAGMMASFKVVAHESEPDATPGTILQDSEHSHSAHQH